MKKTSIALFAMCVFVIGIVWLSAGTPASRAKSQDEGNPVVSQEDEQNGSVVIGHLKTRDRVVTILKTAEGSRYTVKTVDGKTLDARINDEDFKARYPLLHDQIQTGLANNDASLRTDPQFRELDRIKIAR